MNFTCCALRNVYHLPSLSDNSVTITVGEHDVSRDDIFDLGERKCGSRLGALLDIKEAPRDR